MKNNSVTTEKILANMSIETLNTMQLATLEANAKNKDIVLLSPTGSGKTLAYLLPLAQNLTPDVLNVQALILAPTRELVQQIENVWRSMGTGYNVNSCFGGRPSNGEKRDLKIPPAVLIGTPGRIQDHIERGNFNTTNIKTLVLDEFDKALEMGFTEQMESIVSLLPSLSKRMLTSATNTLSIPQYTGIKNPLRLDFSEQNETLTNLKSFTVKGLDNDKMDLLYRTICYLGNEASLIFCNQRETVEKVNTYLSKRCVSNEFFHGKLEQPERERALSKFRNGSCIAFISTDLASRGLDIPDIKNIIHFDAPVRMEEYIHRNGRTARMGAKGRTYLLMGQTEAVPSFISPEPTLLTLPTSTPTPPQAQWATLYIGKGKKDKLSKMDVVGFLFKIGKLENDELGTIEVKDYYSFAAIKADKINKLISTLKDVKIKNMKARFELAE